MVNAAASTGSSPAVSITVDPATRLAPQVLVGFCDVCAAGFQALTMLARNSSVHKYVHALRVSGLDSLAPLVFNSVEGLPLESPIVLVNFGEQEQAPQVSLLLLNVPSTRHQTLLAHAVVELLQQSADPTPEVFLTAALLLPKAPAPVCVLPVNGATLPAALQSLPPLPPSTAIRDHMLAALLHMMHATGMPATAILTPGYKISAVGDSSGDVREAVEHLTSVLEPLLGLPISKVPQELLAPSYKWYNSGTQAAEGGNDIMYL